MGKQERQGHDHILRHVSCGLWTLSQPPKVVKMMDGIDVALDFGLEREATGLLGPWLDFGQENTGARGNERTPSVMGSE